MIYTSAVFANAEHTLVTGTDANGNTETVPYDFTVFRLPEHGPKGFEASGGVIGEYEAPPEPTPSLEPWRFFAMLDLSGKRADLDAFIEALPEPQKTVAKAKLDRSLVFYRDNDLVEQARQAIGMTNEELDAAWTQALSL